MTSVLFHPSEIPNKIPYEKKEKKNNNLSCEFLMLLVSPSGGG